MSVFYFQELLGLKIDQKPTLGGSFRSSRGSFNDPTSMHGFSASWPQNLSLYVVAASHDYMVCMTYCRALYSDACNIRVHMFVCYSMLWLIFTGLLDDWFRFIRIHAFDVQSDLFIMYLFSQKPTTSGQCTHILRGFGSPCMSSPQHDLSPAAENSSTLPSLVKSST